MPSAELYEMLIECASTSSNVISLHLLRDNVISAIRSLVATIAGFTSPFAGMPDTSIAGHFAFPVLAGFVASQVLGIAELFPASFPADPL